MHIILWFNYNVMDVVNVVVLFSNYFSHHK